VFGREKRRREKLEREGRRVPAEILAVELGRFVRETTVGANSATSAKRTVRLRVTPPDGEAYETTLELGSGEPMVPTQPGARLELLVDADDRDRVALPADVVFTLADGAEWRPPQGGIGRGGEAAALAELDRIREAAKGSGEER
jgi:hypothetical protein